MVASRRIAVLAGLWVLTTAGLLRAQSTQMESVPQAPPYVLRRSVQLVMVPVTVKDRHGNLADDLPKEAFHVFEDGKERPIEYFSTETLPLSVVVLLDTGISSVSMAKVHRTLSSLSGAFAGSDEAALYLFDNTIRLAQDFTPQVELLARAIERASPQGTAPSVLGGPLGYPTVIDGVPIQNPGTFPTPGRPIAKRLSDALYTAAQVLKKRPQENRRVVLMVSDGVNGSDNEFSDADAMEALQGADAAVYALSYGSGWATKRADLLGRFARETGGDMAYVQTVKALEAAYSRLMSEARNSYALGFKPAAADGEPHEIAVRITRRDVRVIARSRFIAPPSR